MGDAVDTAAIVALRAMARDQHKTHQHGVARVRMHDREHRVVANLVTPTRKGYRAAGIRHPSAEIPSPIVPPDR